jgi:hypothetical protein
MLKNPLRFPWEHVAGALFTALLGLWLMAPPSSMLTVLTRVPVPPMLVSVVYGVLLLLLYHGVVGEVFDAMVIAFIYSALVWAPFMYLWVVCSLYQYPTWLAVLPPFFAPMGFLGVAYTRQHSFTQPVDPLRIVETSTGPSIKVIQLLAAAFFVYGSIGVLSYLYVYSQHQSLIAFFS